VPWEPKTKDGETFPEGFGGRITYRMEGREAASVSLSERAKRLPRSFRRRNLIYNVHSLMD
jgi:hypothetical protein